MFRKKASKILDGLGPIEDFSHITLDDIVTWTTKARMLKGKPFSFEGRKYLEKPYRSTASEMNIVKPRQMEITEFALNWLLYNLINNPYSVGLYMSDRQDHVGIFSKLRLQAGAIEQSPYLKSKMVPREHNVSWQPFVNGSHLYMFSAWGDFEAARSIPVDFAVVDEMQSVNVEALPVLKQSMSKSPHRRLLKIGTGSDEGDGWWNEWHEGTQFEWNKEVIDSDGTRGIWLPMPNTAEVPGIESYKISQHMAFWIPESEIERNRRLYTPRRFINEVEGWWFKGMRRPLLAKEMMTLFDKNLDFTPSDQVNHTLPIFAGFDWGGGTQAFTVAWIWQLVSENIPRFKLLHLEKISDPSTEAQADRAINLIDKFEIDQVVMDSGGGTRQVEKLSKKYGPRVYKVNYRYDAADPVEIIPKEHRINCDRTWIIETIIDLIKRPEPNSNYPNGIPRIHLPYRDPLKIEWIIDHFTCIEAETSSAQGKDFVKFVHDESTNDDALHAAGYAYLAWVVTKRNEWRWIRTG